MSSYSIFAEYYDDLTFNVDYAKKADYLMRLFKRHKHQPGVMLDLACGTGSLTLELASRGADIFGIDYSSDMLTAAQQKASEAGYDIMFIKQKMQSFFLIDKIDTCICSLDSINHLTSEKDVSACFSRVSEYLQTGGLFVFDCNTVFKHREILGNNCYIYERDNVFCAWQNNYTEQDNKVLITLDFFVPDGKMYKRYSEQFYERAYTEEQLEGMLDNAGMMVEAIYHEDTFRKPEADTQREIFVVRKI